MYKAISIFGGAVAIGIFGGVTAWYLARNETAPQAPAGWVTYESSSGFSLYYPQGYTIDVTEENGRYAQKVKFIVDLKIASGTNLASDSYISVEEFPRASSPANKCTADQFLDLANGAAVQNITDNSINYSFASSTGAGAGNRYEEWMYAVPSVNFCVAVRYFIHYGVLENYPAGAVRAFDHAALLSEFDKVRRSLVLK